LKRFLISIVLLLVCLSFSSRADNLQEERYWGTIIRNPPSNYVLRMDGGKVLNAEWESGYDQWSIGQRIILTTENGSGIMFFENQRTQVAVFPYNPAQIGE
jgi:opacity protein-like surface antigen